MRLKVLSFLFITVLATTNAFSQGALFNKKETGLGLSLRYGHGMDTKSYYFDITGTIGGILDMGSSFGSLRDEREYDSHFAAGFNMELFPLRILNTDKLPIDVSFFGNVGSSDNTGFGSFGASIFRRVIDNNSFYIQSMIQVYRIFPVNFEEPGSYAAGIGLTFAKKDPAIFYINPRISKSDDEVIFDIRIGMAAGYLLRY